jgi:hypothetical protein
MSHYNKDQLLNESIFKDIVKKIKSWFRKIMDKIKNWLKKNSKNIIEFLQLDPVIEFNNEIPV